MPEFQMLVHAAVGLHHLFKHGRISMADFIVLQEEEVLAPNFYFLTANT